MSTLVNKTVLITGAGSGIGKIMARKMLEEKARVVIWDIDHSKIRTTITELSAIGNISGYQIDVSDSLQIETVAKLTREKEGAIDVLINNAGVITGKYFQDHSSEEIIRTMQINANAPMLITLQFISEMLERNSGHICTISSSAGLIGNSRMSAYVASKWAATGWSESLRLELKQSKSDVRATNIMPYYINTGMFKGVQSRLLPILDPESVAASIISAIKKDRETITIPGYLYHLARLGQALFPISWFDWLADNVLGIYKTMNHFTGRKS